MKALPAAHPLARLLLLLPTALVRTLFGSADIVVLALRRAARRKGFVWGRTLYAAAILAIILLIAASPPTDASDLPKAGRDIFIVLAVVQGLLAVFVPPVLMAHTIARERRDGTAELLLLTHGDPSHVIRGLVTSRLLLLFVVFLGGAPVASIAALLGGISFSDITYLTLGCLLASLFGASLGAFLGADVAPRLAPFLALVGSLVSLWLLQYPMLMLAVGIGAMAAAGAPSWVIVVAVLMLVGPVLLLCHRLLTREAGRSLVRRLGEPIAPPPPPRPLAASSRRRRARSPRVEAILAPGLARVGLGAVATSLPIALGLALGTMLIPDAFVVTEVVRTLLVALEGLAGFAILGLLVLAVTFYPAVQVASLLSDATLVLVALAPIDLSRTLRQVERRALTMGGIALLVAAVLIAPATIAPKSGTSIVGHLLGMTFVALILLFAAALSLYIGTLQRSVPRALGAMAGIAVVAVGSIGVFAIWGVSEFHPLAAPFVLMASAATPRLEMVSHNLTLLPLAILLHLAARQRLVRTFREPFEELSPEMAHFG